MKKIVIIAGAAVVLLGGGAGGLFATGMLDPLLGGGDQVVEDAEAVAKAEDLEKAQEAIFVELDPLMAPVIVGSKVRQQVMLTLSVQVKNIGAKNDLVRIMPKLRDAMLRELFDKPLVRDETDGTLDIPGIKGRMLTVAHGLLEKDGIQDILIVRAALTG